MYCKTSDGSILKFVEMHCFLVVKNNNPDRNVEGRVITLINYSGRYNSLLEYRGGGYTARYDVVEVLPNYKEK